MTFHRVVTGERFKLEAAIIGVILATWIAIGGGLIAVEYDDLFGALS
ncbi:MAG: hypothetical protein ABEI76_06815 [Halobacteriales archaeon]